MTHTGLPCFPPPYRAIKMIHGLCCWAEMWNPGVFLFLFFFYIYIYSNSLNSLQLMSGSLLFESHQFTTTVLSSSLVLLSELTDQTFTSTRHETTCPLPQPLGVKKFTVVCRQLHVDGSPLFLTGHFDATYIY